MKKEDAKKIKKMAGWVAIILISSILGASDDRLTALAAIHVSGVVVALLIVSAIISLVVWLTLRIARSKRAREVALAAFLSGAFSTAGWVILFFLGVIKHPQ